MRRVRIFAWRPGDDRSLCVDRESGTISMLRNCSGTGSRSRTGSGVSMGSSDLWDLEEPSSDNTGAHKGSVMLRLAGQPALYLAGDRAHGVILFGAAEAASAMNLSRHADRVAMVTWAVGFLQPRRSELFERDQGGGSQCSNSSTVPGTFVQRGVGARRSAAENAGALPVVPHAEVWLLASQSYQRLLSMARASLAAAGGSFCVHLRWFRNIRDTSSNNWDVGFDSLAYSYRKLLLTAEALLLAQNLSPSTQATCMSSGMVIIMDLDVQVFQGWQHAMQACLRAADVCMPQQPAHPTEDANGGLLALRARGRPAAQALLHATLARLQSLEVLLRAGAPPRSQYRNEGLSFVDQPAINAILRQARRFRGPRSLRWGIFNPDLFPVVGTVAALMRPWQLLLHHATGPINLKQKLQCLEQAAKLVTLTRDLCGEPPLLSTPPSLVPTAGNATFRARLRHRNERVGAMGPHLPICLSLMPSDPHFAPAFEAFRIHHGFLLQQRRQQQQPHQLANNRLQGLSSDLMSRPEAALISGIQGLALDEALR